MNDPDELTIHDWTSLATSIGELKARMDNTYDAVNEIRTSVNGVVKEVGDLTVDVATLKGRVKNVEDRQAERAPQKGRGWSIVSGITAIVAAITAVVAVCFSAPLP